MRVFVYEFVTGGGMWSCGDGPAANWRLLAEGRAMARAITADFCSLDGTEVWTTRDARLPELHPAGCRVTNVASRSEEAATIERLAAAADWTLLIAPETGGELARRCKLVERVGGRLLSPPSSAVSIAADKQATAELLACRGVPVPRGVVIAPTWRATRSASGHHLAEQVIHDWGNFPVVLKPLDGCGSEGVRLISTPDELQAVRCARPVRCEQFVPGLAASVAVLCGSGGNYTLPACQQILSSDGRFAYLGGRLPLAALLDQRARHLAAAAAAALSQARGYIGVDLVLGAEEDGRGDRVIEINPRLTTSYVGLRAAAKTNLAAAMLAVAEGRPPDLCFGQRRIEFAADGKIK